MNKRIFKIESQISESIKSDNGRYVHFEYTKEVIYVNDFEMAIMS